MHVINLQQPPKTIEGPDKLSWGSFHLHDGLGVIVFQHLIDQHPGEKQYVPGDS